MEAVKPAVRDRTHRCGRLEVGWFGAGREATMQEVLRSNDFVITSFAQAVLRNAGIDNFLADLHTSLAEGSIGAFPRRLLVAEDDRRQARRVLSEAGLQAWLVADGEARA